MRGHQRSASNGPNSQIPLSQHTNNQINAQHTVRPKSAKWHQLADTAFDDITGSDRRCARLPAADNAIPSQATYRAIFVGSNVHNPHVSLVQCNRCRKSVTKAAFPAHHERCVQTDAVVMNNRLSDGSTPSTAISNQRQSSDSPFQSANIDPLSLSDVSESKKRKSPDDAVIEPKDKKNKKQRKSLNTTKFNPDIHCGVYDRGNQCMELVDCRAHTLAMKKHVDGRSVGVGTLIARRKKEQDRKKSGSSSFDSDDSSSSSEIDGSSDSDNASSPSGSSDPSSSSGSDSGSSSDSDSSDNERVKHSKSKLKQPSSNTSKKSVRDRVENTTSLINSTIPAPSTPDFSSTLSPREINLKKAVSPSSNSRSIEASSNLPSPSLRPDSLRDTNKLKKPRSKRVRGPLMMLGISTRSSFLSYAGPSHHLAMARSARAVQSMLIGNRPVPIGANPIASIYVELYNAAHVIEDKRPVVQPPNPPSSSKMTPINTLNPALSNSSRLPVATSSLPVVSRSPPLAPVNPTASPVLSSLPSGGARTPSGKSSSKPTKESSNSKKDKDGKSSKDKDKSDSSVTSKDKDKEKKKSKDKDRDRDRERDASKPSKDKNRDRESSSKDEGSKKSSKDKDKDSGKQSSKHKDKSSKDKDKEKSSSKFSSDRDKDRDKAEREKEKSKKDKSSKDKSSSSSKNKSTSLVNTPLSSHMPLPMSGAGTPTSIQPPQHYYPPASPSNHSVGSQHSQRYQPPPNQPMNTVPPQYPRPPSSGSSYGVNSFPMSRGPSLPVNGPVSPHGHAYTPHMSPQSSVNTMRYDGNVPHNHNPGSMQVDDQVMDDGSNAMLQQYRSMPPPQQYPPGRGPPPQPGRSLNNQVPPHSPAAAQSRIPYRAPYPTQQMNPAYANTAPGYGIQSPVPPITQQMSTPPFNQRVFPPNYARGMTMNRQAPYGGESGQWMEEYDPSMMSHHKQ